MFKLFSVLLLAVAALGRNTYFDDKTPEQIKGMFGTFLETTEEMRQKGVRVVEGSTEAELAGLPAKFTAGVDKWANCFNTIHYIKDQSACGSCWAVAASEVVADRTCIGCPSLCPSNPNGEYVGQNKPCLVMSAAEIMSCCSYCGQGCNGGYISEAMRYWQYTGVVTGGAYGTKCGCYPYTVQPGLHSEVSTPKCHQSGGWFSKKIVCQEGYQFSADQSNHKAKDYYAVSQSAMMNEIYTNGPIECGFTVYKNFMDYPQGDGVTDGVYTRTSGQELGGHAIKIIGWGTSPSGIDYWLINNSWNTTWGNAGTFKYARGTNLGGMEAGCSAGMASCNTVPDNTLNCIN